MRLTLEVLAACQKEFSLDESRHLLWTGCRWAATHLGRHLRTTDDVRAAATDAAERTKPTPRKSRTSPIWASTAGRSTVPTVRSGGT